MLVFWFVEEFIGDAWMHCRVNAALIALVTHQVHGRFADGVDAVEIFLAKELAPIHFAIAFGLVLHIDLIADVVGDGDFHFLADLMDFTDLVLQEVFVSTEKHFVFMCHVSLHKEDPSLSEHFDVVLTFQSTP